MIIEQTQNWNDKDIVVLMDGYGRATVQMLLYKEEQNFGGTAWIWDLWTDPLDRNEGLATRLINLAEVIAKKNGHKSVFLEWEAKNSERWVLDWYLRRGYEEREFDRYGTSSLLEKKL